MDLKNISLVSVKLSGSAEYNPEPIREHCIHKVQNTPWVES